MHITPPDQKRPASGKQRLPFKCKLCDKKIVEQIVSKPNDQFVSRLQHLLSKHALDVHVFFLNWFQYLEDKDA